MTGFVAVSVFDVSQLTPEKRPPEFFEPLEGDQEALCEVIVTAATVDGFQVETEKTRSAHGYSSGRASSRRKDSIPPHALSRCCMNGRMAFCMRVAIGSHRSVNSPAN